MIEGDNSAEISAYKLPITDVDEKRRNFSGYQVNQYVNLADLQKGDSDGTTETDSKTDPKGSGGYTRINSRKY